MEGFWSLTMYDDKYFFVDNKLNRFTTSARAASSRQKQGRFGRHPYPERIARQTGQSQLAAGAEG